MDFFTNLHVVMAIVAIIVAVSARGVFVYRTLLRDALLFALEPGVTGVMDATILRKNVEKSKEDLMRVNNILIPVFHVGLLSLGFLWFALAQQIATPTLTTACALVIAGAMTAVITQGKVPLWFTDWTVAMMAAQNKTESAQLQKEVAEDAAKMQALLARADAGEVLNETEQKTMMMLMIRLSNAEVQLKRLDVQSEAIIAYSQHREEQKKLEAKQSVDEDD